MKPRALAQIAVGAMSYIPGLYDALIGGGRAANGRILSSPLYGLHVFLKHWTLANETIPMGMPARMVELGTGDSLGVATSALLSGVRHFTGLDATPFIQTGPSRSIIQPIVNAFEARNLEMPGGWPQYGHLLGADGFPTSIERQDRRHIETVIAEVEAALAGKTGKMISYIAPYNVASIEPASTDFLMSHSVLEHVSDMPGVMAMTAKWVRPGGVVSHQFDLSDHGFTGQWDGHRAYPSFAWNLAMGKRPFHLNRLSFRAVIKIIEDAGFRILRAERQIRDPLLSSRQLSSRWRDEPVEEARTVGGYVVAVKT